MPAVRLLGLDLDERAGVVDPPVHHGLGVRSWASKLDAGAGRLQVEAWLEIGGEHTLLVQLQLRVRLGESGAWAVEEGEHPQGPDARLRLIQGTFDLAPRGPAFELLLGPIVQRSQTFPAHAIEGRAGELRIRSVEDYLYAPDDLPVSIESVASGFRLDLALPEIQFEQGNFRLRAMSLRGMRHPRKRRKITAKLFPSEHLSRAAAFRLDAAPGTRQLSFDVHDAGMLALHVFQRERDGGPTADNPVIAPLALSGHALRATLDGTYDEGVRLSVLTVQPGARLHVFAFADRTNAPEVLRIERELGLHMRVGSKQRPATLLIAPEHRLPASEATAVPVSRPTTQGAPFHGQVASTRFLPGQRGWLVCEPERVVRHDGEVPGGVDPAMVTETTLPWVLFEAQGDAQGFEHPKPGAAYLSSGSVGGRIETMRFARGELPLPLLPERFSQTPPELEQSEALAAEHNRRLASNDYRLVESTHESNMLERPPANTDMRLRVDALFRDEDSSTPDSLPSAVPIRLRDYTVVRDYGPVQLQTLVPGGGVPDYVLIEADSPEQRFLPTSRFDWVLGNAKHGFRIGGGGPRGQTEAPADGKRVRPLAIVKLSRSLTLEDIFERERLDTRIPGYPTLDLLDHVIDATTSERSWVGLVLFSVPLDYSGQRLLANMLPAGPSTPPVHLTYVAISPQKPGDRADGGFSTSARVLWRHRGDMPPSPDAPNEASFKVEELDIRWYDNALVHFHASARLVFQSLFGVRRSPKPLAIEGAYDQEADKIVFRGRLSEPLNVVPEAWSYGPIAKLLIAAADIREAGGATVVDLRGSFVWRSFGFHGRDWFRTPLDLATDFTGLTLNFPQPGSRDTSWIPLPINYANLRLPADAVVFELGFIKLTIGDIGVSWDGDAAWNRYLPLYAGGQFDERERFAYLRCRLELMKLPELAADAMDSLVLDFLFAFGTDYALGHWDANSARFVVKGVGVERLRLALLRFLVVEAGRIAIETQEMSIDGRAEMVDWLVLENISVTVLNQALIEDFSLYVFSVPDGRRGFLGMLAPGAFPEPPDDPEEETAEDRKRREEAERSGSGTPRKKSKRRKVARKRVGQAAKTANNFLELVDWALVAHNMQMDADVAKQLIAIDNEGSPGDLLADAFSRDLLLPQPDRDDTGDWIFGAGVGVPDVFTGKFLFQEGVYYGLALDSPLLEKYFRVEVAASVLYVVGDEPDEDAFIVSLRVPEVVAPALTFLGGTITLEVVLNGSFYLDVGFPHLDDDGVRDWDRAFGMIITPFIGSAGLYLRYRRMQLSAAATPVPGELMVLSVGYAAQIGLAASYGGGTFQVTASAGIYYALQGDLVLYKEEVRGLRLVGAVGLIVQASAELDWWIVSARLDISLAAEARATLTWADANLRLPSPAPGSSLVPLFTSLQKASDKAVLSIDLVVVARASAQACIGSGWFKICASFSVELPLRFAYDFEL